jgi:hypothetical protein
MFDLIPDFAIVSFFVRLAYFLIALGVVIGFLRWLDYTMGIHGQFKSKVWDVIAQNPLALAVYHGLRFYAVVWLAGQFLS